MTNKTEDKFYFGKPGQPERFANTYSGGVMYVDNYARLAAWDNGYAIVFRTESEAKSFISRHRLSTRGAHPMLLQGKWYVRVPEKTLNFSRPGQPERFENAPWMSEVNRMLRDLGRERAKVKIWISGSNSVTTSASSRGDLRSGGFTFLVGGRIADYLTRAVPVATMQHTEQRDYPKKGLWTSFYKVSNLPKELIAYLKNWGIGTTPQAFSGFTGASAVAYSRPGQPDKFDASSLDRGDFAEASTSPMLGKLLAAKVMPEGGWRAVQVGSDTLVISFEDADLASDFGRRVATKGYNATSPVQAIGRYWNVEVKNGK